METYRFRSLDPHYNNEQTMEEYLSMHLDEKAEIVVVDGTYAEICLDGTYYACHASGDGDSYNHKIQFEELTN